MARWLRLLWWTKKALLSARLSQLCGCVVPLAVFGVGGCQQGLIEVPSASQQPFDARALAEAAQISSEPAAPPRAGEPPHLAGRLELADGLKTKVRAGDTVFVLARDAGSRQIVAVTRMMAAHPAAWPMAFVLTDERLRPGTMVLIGARVDKDADASTKKPGDLVGELANPLRVPADGVIVRIEQTL